MTRYSTTFLEFKEKLNELENKPRSEGLEKLDEDKKLEAIRNNVLATVLDIEEISKGRVDRILLEYSLERKYDTPPVFGRTSVKSSQLQTENIEVFDKLLGNHKVSQSFEKYFGCSIFEIIKAFHLELEDLDRQTLYQFDDSKKVESYFSILITYYYSMEEQIESCEIFLILEKELCDSIRSKLM